MRVLLVVLALTMPFYGAMAGNLDDGMQSYDGGHYADALVSWKRAADEGNLMAMNSIANLYMQGEGVVQDLALAAEWYRRAAERGDAVAQANLGDLLSRGAGVKQNRIEAYMWWALAARQGIAWVSGEMKSLSKKMTELEIGEAKSRVKGWMPKPN